MGFFPALGALHAVQYFIAPVDTWSSLLLASKTRRVIEVANDAPILQVELRREIKLDHRAEKTTNVCAAFPRDSTSGSRRISAAWDFGSNLLSREGKPSHYVTSTVRPCPLATKAVFVDPFVPNREPMNRNKRLLSSVEAGPSDLIC